MRELTFFIPFKIVIWKVYSAYILSYCGLLLAIVFAAALAGWPSVGGDVAGAARDDSGAGALVVWAKSGDAPDRQCLLRAEPALCKPASYTALAMRAITCSL
jgi:hypothetical protein